MEEMNTMEIVEEAIEVAEEPEVEVVDFESEDSCEETYVEPTTGILTIIAGVGAVAGLGIGAWELGKKAVKAVKNAKTPAFVTDAKAGITAMKDSRSARKAAKLAAKSEESKDSAQAAESEAAAPADSADPAVPEATNHRTRKNTNKNT